MGLKFKANPDSSNFANKTFNSNQKLHLQNVKEEITMNDHEILHQSHLDGEEFLMNTSNPQQKNIPGATSYEFQHMGQLQESNNFQSPIDGYKELRKSLLLDPQQNAIGRNLEKDKSSSKGKFYLTQVLNKNANIRTQNSIVSKNKGVTEVQKNKSGKNKTSQISNGSGPRAIFSPSSVIMGYTTEQKAGPKTNNIDPTKIKKRNPSLSQYNLNRNGSKESWSDYNQCGKNYYGSFSNAIQSVKSTQSPMKYSQNLLTQNFNQGVKSSQESKIQQKQFLNLTLQKLIQQQKGGLQTIKNIKKVKKDMNMNQDDVIKAILSTGGNKLQVDTDSSEQNNDLIYHVFGDPDKVSGSNIKGNQSSDGRGCNQLNSSHFNASSKSIGRLGSKFDYQSKFPANSDQFSQTTAIMFDNNSKSRSRIKVNKTKQSRSSLKATQQLNILQDDMNLSLKNTNNQSKAVRKQSALSTYSMNTALTTTTHLKKNQNVMNNQTVTGQGHLIGKKKKSQQSQKKVKDDQSILNQILNFYQHEDYNGHSNGIGFEDVEKTQQRKVQTIKKDRIQKVASKHLGNVDLEKYLQIQTNIALNEGKKDHFSKKSSIKSPIKKQTLIEPQIETFGNREQRNSLIKGQYENNREGRYTGTQQKKKQSRSKQKIYQEQIQEFQNKTQPLPKNIIEIAKGENINLSTGTSILGKKASQQSRGKSSLYRKREEKEQQQEEYYDYQHSNYKPKIGNKKDVEIGRLNQQNQGKNQQKEQDETYMDIQKATFILEEEDIEERENNGSSENKQQLNSKLDKYVLGKQIGQGAYAVVRYATTKKDNQQYAIKVYDKSKLTDKNRQKSVRREIKLLQKMNSSHIVKIYEAFETETHVYLVMEYVVGGSLHSYLKERPDRRLKEEEAKAIFKEIMVALSYCHRKSIAHRDIKLENILLDENNHVKLIDFGFSTCIPNDKKIKMFCGTPSYMAPEIVSKVEYAGPPADIWASAVLLFALLNGSFPFRGATDKELYRKIFKGSFTNNNEKVSQEFLDLLTKLLNVNPDERMTAEQILEDPWFQKESSEQDIAQKKREFKAKILGSNPKPRLEKTTILNLQQNEGSKDLMKVQGNTFNQTQPILNLDFSDYGLNNNQVSRKVNQEAYQAYYNSYGGNFFGQNNGTNQNFQKNNLNQNPYFNNFFQNSNGNGSSNTNNGNGQQVVISNIFITQKINGKILI